MSPAPLAPPAPQLIEHHDDGEDDGGHHHGELHIKFEPLSNNPGGPVSSYRVAVINESDPAPFDPDSLGAWSPGAPHWVAADIDPRWFRLHDEFVVGDGRRYGDYVNYGPLNTDEYDIHVTVGTVSTLNGTTKGGDWGGVGTSGPTGNEILKPFSSLYSFLRHRHP